MNEILEQIELLSDTPIELITNLTKLAIVIGEIEPEIAKRIKIDENGNPRKVE